MMRLRLLAMGILLTAGSGLPALACIQDIQPATVVAFKPRQTIPSDEAAFEAALAALATRVVQVGPDRVLIQAGGGDPTLNRRRAYKAADALVLRAVPPSLIDFKGDGATPVAPDTVAIWLDLKPSPGCTLVPPAALPIATPSSGTAPK